MKRLSSFITRLVNVSGHVFGWLVAIMMLLVLFEVFMRYIVGQPPLVADEFSAYMLVALSFLGMAYTWKEKGHVRITALVSRLPSKVSSWLRLITLVLGFAFILAITQSSYAFLIASFERGATSSTYFRTPLQGPHMTIPIGFTILALVLIVEIIKAIRSIRSGKSIEEKVQ